MQEQIARGRKPIVLHANEFQNIIKSVEAQHKPTTRSQLWQLVEQTEYAKTRQPRPLTAQVAMLKAEEFGTEIVTPKGQRGRVKGQGLPEAARVALRKPRKRRKVTPEILEQQKKEYPKSQWPILEKAANGSVKDCIKAFCLGCSSTKKSVALCEIKTCPLWVLRPYSSRAAIKAAQENDTTKMEELEA